MKGTQANKLLNKEPGKYRGTPYTSFCSCVFAAFETGGVVVDFHGDFVLLFGLFSKLKLN